MSVIFGHKNSLLWFFLKLYHRRGLFSLSVFTGLVHVARGGDFCKKIGGDKKVENLMKFSSFHLIRHNIRCDTFSSRRRLISLLKLHGLP